MKNQKMIPSMISIQMVLLITVVLFLFGINTQWLRANNFRALTSPTNFAVNETNGVLGPIRLMSTSTENTKFPDTIELTLNDGATFSFPPQINTRGFLQQLGGTLVSPNKFVIQVPGGIRIVASTDELWVGFELTAAVINVDDSRLDDSDPVTISLTSNGGSFVFENSKIIVGYIRGKKLHRLFHVIAPLNISANGAYTIFNVGNLSTNAGLEIKSFVWFDNNGIKLTSFASIFVNPNGTHRFALSQIFVNSQGISFDIGSGRVEFDIEFVGPAGIGGRIDVKQIIGDANDFSFISPTVEIIK